MEAKDLDIDEESWEADKEKSDQTWEKFENEDVFKDILDKSNTLIVTNDKLSFGRFDNAKFISLNDLEYFIGLWDCNSKIYLDIAFYSMIKELQTKMVSKKIYLITNDEIMDKLNLEYPITLTDLIINYLDIFASPLSNYRIHSFQLPYYSNRIYLIKQLDLNDKDLDSIIFTESKYAKSPRGVSDSKSPRGVSDSKSPRGVSNIRSLSGIRISSSESLLALKHLKEFRYLNSISLIIHNFDTELSFEYVRKIERIRILSIRKLEIKFKQNVENKELITTFLTRMFPNLIEIHGDGVFTKYKSNKVKLISGFIKQSLKLLPNLRELNLLNSKMDLRLQNEIQNNPVIKSLKISREFLENNKVTYQYVEDLQIDGKLYDVISAVKIIESFPSLIKFKSNTLEISGNLRNTKLQSFTSTNNMKLVNYPSTLKYLDVQEFNFIALPKLKTLIRTNVSYIKLEDFDITKYPSIENLDILLAINSNRLDKNYEHLKLLSILILIEKLDLSNLKRLEKLILYGSKVDSEIIFPQNLMHLELRKFKDAKLKIHPNNIKKISVIDNIDNIEWIISNKYLFDKLKTIIVSSKYTRYYPIEISQKYSQLLSDNHLDLIIEQ